MSDMLPEKPTLADLQLYVADRVVERGFDKDTVAERFMLLFEECGELARAARKFTGMGATDDRQTAQLEDEAADVLNVLLGICNMLKIDLEQAYRTKEAKNQQRTWK